MCCSVADVDLTGLYSAVDIFWVPVSGCSGVVSRCGLIHRDRKCFPDGLSIVLTSFSASHSLPLFCSPATQGCFSSSIPLSFHRPSPLPSVFNFSTPHFPSNSLSIICLLLHQPSVTVFPAAFTPFLRQKMKPPNGET